MKLVELVGGLDIDDKLKIQYTALANLFEKDIQHNIVRSHFELEEETGMPYDIWDGFLSVVEVAGWINATMRSLATAGERRLIKQMGKGGVEAKDVNSYKAIREFNAENNDVDNSKVVVIYLSPEDE